MNNRDLISVIIPTYNRGYIIERTIKSVMEQTYTNIEIIIVDDGSTDDTSEIIKKYKSTRIKYFFIEHQGACAARNYGVKKANGKYIAFLDSDDTWKKNKLEKQKNMLEEQKCDIVFCSFISDDNGKETIIPSTLENNIRISQKDLLSGNFISTQTLFGKYKCFAETKFDEELKRVQDWELAIRLTEKYDVRYLKDTLATQFIQKDSLTRNKHFYIDALKKVLTKHLELFSLDKNGFMVILNEIEKASIGIGNDEIIGFSSIHGNKLDYDQCIKLYNSITKRKVKVFYPLNNNCGDILNKILLDTLFDINVINASIDEAELYAIGSELGSIKKSVNHRIIWGTGFVNYSDKTMFDINDTEILALRGYLSKNKIEKDLNIKLNVPVGDPGILASKIIEIKKEKKYDVGIIAHFREKDDPFFNQLKDSKANSTIIDIQEEPISVIEKISQCRTIVSSSLHGLIIADSFHIPNIHVKVTDKLVGDGFKFDDYYSAYNVKHNYITCEEALKIDYKTIISRYKVRKQDITRKQRELLKCFHI